MSGIFGIIVRYTLFVLVSFTLVVEKLKGNPGRQKNGIIEIEWYTSYRFLKKISWVTSYRCGFAWQVQRGH